LTNLGKKLEELFSAATFAEAGEFDTAREVLDGERKVLLVLTGRETDVKSLKYALSIARRTDASLEVLAAADGDASRTAAMLARCEKEAREQSIGFKATKKGGCIKTAVVGYAKNRRDLLCVVVESTDALNIDCSREEKKLAGVWEKLGCPLALVSEKP
jgi:hypothetical protein